MEKYEDIIKLSRPISKHSKMSLYQRSAQFAPFNALTGYEEKVNEIARLTERKIELDEERKAMLDLKLQIIQKNLSKKPKLEITYFIKDIRKDGGRYETIINTIKKIDNYNAQIIMQNDFKIGINEIVDINSDILKNIYNI